MIDTVSVINNHRISAVIVAAIVATMIMIMIVTIDTHCHNGCKPKPGWVKAVIIRRVIRYIGG